jgi:hypothetical protein
LDLLPSHVFEDCLPHSFMTDHIHWYDHERDEVFFRPREDPWSSGNAVWRLIREGTAWRLVKDVGILANIASKTARTISKIFSALEDPQHIHTLFDTETLWVHISLPRLQLDFQIEHQSDRIESRQYRGMIVDHVQTMGTLVGLTSKLVLRPGSTIQDRTVLIPVPRTFDSRAIRRTQAFNQHHVTVSIKKDKAYKVFAYSLDTVLGRLLESGDVQRRLFLAFLHAVTSHCLPDPLTGYTGTEAALQILQSASVRSFEFLTTENVKLLYEIAALSPSRSFYPRNIMEMQQVRWDPNLPSLSQHPRLRTYAEDIVKQARTMQPFYPDHMPDTSAWTSSDDHLEARNSIRTSTFRVHDFGAEAYSSTADVHYKARDVYTQSTRGERTYIVASLIMRDQAALHTSIPDLKDILLRTHFKNAIIDGCSDSYDGSELRFDTSWLRDSTIMVREYWCDLHHALPNLSRSCNKYDIMAWLSTMAFAKSADMNILQAFAAFYRLQTMAVVKPPSAAKFDLSQGSIWVPGEITHIVQSSAKSFEDSDEAKSPKQGSETNKQHISRIKALFHTRRDAVVGEFVAEIKQQWPGKKPTSPSSPQITKYLNASRAMSQIMPKFKTWYQNRQFTEYLQQTSALVAQQNIIAIAPPKPVLGVRLEVNNSKGIKMMFHVGNVFTATPPSIARDDALHPTMPALVPPQEPTMPTQDLHTVPQDTRKKARLEQLCRDVTVLADSKCEKDYVENLRSSCASLETLTISDSDARNARTDSGSQSLLQSYLDSCKEYFKHLNLALIGAVAGNNSLSDEIGLLVQHSPRISPTFWLSQLHRDRFETLPEVWKTLVIEYGLAVTQLHRAQRLVALAAKPADLLDELGHIGHSNWSPREFPETLLLEAESGILIRREQEYIASQMRDSQDDMNVVLQLLMGGGKSSTIVPMLAATLADKEK